MRPSVSLLIGIDLDMLEKKPQNRIAEKSNACIYLDKLNR